ncbi:MAG: MFS transporter [Firmicutes bacterium]|nr:MFS transporter [Bacillota bacterium]
MEKEKTSLKIGTILTYGLGGMFPLGFVLCVAGYYLNIFMTDVAGFTAALAAVLYTAIQIIKMVTMAMSGAIVDKYEIKGGKYRTWILISGIVLGISFPLCFLYLDLPVKTYVVIFVLFYVLQSLSYNVSWTAQHAVIAPMSKNSADVVLLNTVSQFAGLFTSVVYMVIGNMLLNGLPTAGTKQMYFGPCAVYGVVIILGSILLYALCGKYEKGGAGEAAKAKQKGMSLGEMLKSFKGPAIPFFLSFTFTAATTGFFNALLAHFATYVLENPNVVTLSLGVTSIAGVLGAVLTPMIAKSSSRKNVHIACQIISCIAYVVLALFGKNQVLFIVMRAVATFVGMPSTILMTAMANDIGDHMEMNGEVPPRAFLQSLAGTANRAGLVISAALGSSVLVAIGYSAGAVFTDAMKTSLTTFIAALPAGCCALAAIIMLFYRVDEKKIAQYKASKNQ